VERDHVSIGCQQNLLDRLFQNANDVYWLSQPPQRKVHSIALIFKYKMTTVAFPFIFNCVVAPVSNIYGLTIVSKSI
jgi:hypothetical protein